MSVNAPSPLRGLFTVDETHLLLTVLATFTSGWGPSDDARANLMIWAEELYQQYFRGSDEQHAGESLMDKLQELDAWEADFLMTAFWSPPRNLLVNQRCLRAGLPPVYGNDEWYPPPDPDAAVEVRYSCGHSETRGIRDGDRADDADEVCTAPVPCPECRADEAERTANEREWTPLRGTAKQRAVGAEIRLRVLEDLESEREDVSDPAQKTFFAVAISHLQSIEEARWWLPRHIAKASTIVDEELTAALAGASRAQIRSLLSHHDPSLRAMALRQVG